MTKPTILYAVADVAEGVASFHFEREDAIREAKAQRHDDYRVDGWTLDPTGSKYEWDHSVWDPDPINAWKFEGSEG